MAKIPLRTYIREIESLIDRGNTDEAIAHCRHILKTFPKHLDTYRMLGKAFLESQRYPDALEVFKRVLLSVPDDFVAHVGMSIINDEQKKLDATIWHMERAFEVQPSNAAIQAELQRLYGRRDGMEPHKIRLTRGALAHMYVQGELYPQAIGEIRAVLAEDPSRTDMQVLLALAYFRHGQKVEATETCSQLLARYAYCLNANRILVEILPGTGMAENVATYRSRVVELDPYASYSPGSIFQSDEVAENAIMVDRLEYRAEPAGPQTDWRDSIGTSLGAGATAAAAEPDWLREAAPTPTPAPTPAWPGASEPTIPPSSPAPAQDADKTDIPEWMRNMGWEPSSGTFDESAQTLAEEPPAAEGGLEKADLPDWIKAMAPPSAPAPEPAPSSTTSDEDADWLNQFGSASAPSQPSQPAATGTPDWLADLGEPTYPPAAQPAETGSVPDWVSDLEQPTSAPTAPTSAPSPDWLTNLGEPTPEPSSAPASEPLETPDWLSQLGESGTAEESAKPADLPEWMSGFGEQGDISSSQEQPPVEPAPAEPSSWMSQPEPTQTEPNMRDSSVEPLKPTEPQPTTPSSLGPSIGDLGTSSADQDAAMLWLESLAAKQGAKSEELITDPNARLEKPPEWVEQAKAAGEAQAVPSPAREEDALPPAVESAPSMPEIPQEEPAPIEPESSWPESAETGMFSTPSDVSAADQTSAWLRNLDAEEKEEKEEPQAPVWSGEIEVTPPITGQLSEPTAEVDLPAWLRGFDKEAATKPVTDELPNWLKEEEARQEQSLPEPTRPSDWTPEMPKAKAPVAEPPKPVETPKPEPTPAVAAKPKPEPQKVAETPKPMPEPQKVARPAPKAAKPASAAVTSAQVEEPVPAPKPAKPAVRKKAEPPAADRAKLKRTGMLPPAVDPTLARAREDLAHAKIPDALQSYSTLIRKGKFLEEVTFDLKEALYRFPVEVLIWQVLGDAYMRANRLQDALDAYTKAEELLR